MSNTEPSLPALDPTSESVETDPTVERDAEDGAPDAPAPAFRTPALGPGLNPTRGKPS